MIKYIKLILFACILQVSYAADSILDLGDDIPNNYVQGCFVGGAVSEQDSFKTIDESSVVLQADNVSGNNTSNAVATGGVSISRGNELFASNWVRFERGDTHFTAGDKVTFTRDLDRIDASWADYSFDLDRGVFSDAVANLGQDNLTATGELIEVHDKKHYSAYNGAITSCNLSNPLWIIKAESFNLDYVSNVGIARQATFYVESVPVFYTPYMSFSLGGRKSGFLLPNIGSSTNTGITTGLPFYWNMAPNYDMIVEPRWLEYQGYMISDQFRYITSGGHGSIYTEQMPSSTSIDGLYRNYWHLDDTHILAPNVVAGYQYNSVSDNNYFNDLGNFYSATDNINLERSAFINYTPSYATMGIKVQGFQTIQPDSLPPVAKIYSMLPQITFNLNPISILSSLSFRFDSQITNFYSIYMQSAQRYYIYPSLTYSLVDNVSGYSRAKAGYNMAYYNIEPLAGYQANSYVVNRNVPIFSLDNGLYFDRVIDLFNGNYTQTIEPRLYYLYVPQVNQSNIPLFDTSPNGNSLSQLFGENRFSGVDRINNANDITLGATTRLINDANGLELLNLGLGYRYYVTPENSFAYGNYTQYPQLFIQNADLITEIGSNLGGGFRTNLFYQYDTIYANTDAYGLGMNYSPDVGKVLNTKFTYQYNLPLLYYAWQPGQAYAPASYENQYAIDMSFQWPITTDKKWSVLGRTNYDFTVGVVLNALGGIEYSMGCFAIRFVVENYVSNLVNRTNAYFIQFNLKGLGTVGTDPTGDLGSNIQGYSPQTFIR